MSPLASITKLLTRVIVKGGMAAITTIKYNIKSLPLVKLNHKNVGCRCDAAGLTGRLNWDVPSMAKIMRGHAWVMRECLSRTKKLPKSIMLSMVRFSLRYRATGIGISLHNCIHHSECRAEGSGKIARSPLPISVNRRILSMLIRIGGVTNRHYAHGFIRYRWDT